MSRGCKRRKIRRPVMVNIVGAQHHASELLQKIIVFVGGSRRTNYANGFATVAIANLGELLPDQLKRFFPSRGNQATVLAHQRLRQTIFVLCEVKRIAALDAKEIPVDATFVAIVSTNNFHASIRPSDAQRRLAAISAMRACGADVLHLPGARLVAICAGSQRADWAYVDAHATLFALKVVAKIRNNRGTCPAVLNSKRCNIHTFVANPHTAIAENAARTIEIDHRRPLLLVAMVLDVNVFRLGRAVGERHVLQFALAAGVAHRTIERMVAKQHFDHALARLPDLLVVGGDDHAFADYRRAGRLQLRHLLDTNQAHAARALQRQVRVVAERGHLDTDGFAGLDEKRSGGRRDGLAIDGDAYEFRGVCHQKHLRIEEFTDCRIQKPCTPINSNSTICKFENSSILTQKPAIVVPLPPFQKGRVFLPNGLRTPYETSSQLKLLAARPHRPADRTCVPACSRTSTEYYQ